jgi:glycosyltransferase involved in cell wall biosynthesis
LEALETLLYRAADRIVAVTDAFVDEIVAHGGEREKIRVVKNGVDLEVFRPQPKENEIRRRYGLAGKFVATYIGTHGMAHGLGTILETAERLSGDDRFRFLLVGEGAEKAKLKADAEARGLTNLVFVDQQPRGTIPDFIAASDACLVLLRSHGLFKTVLPSKIFEFWGCGRPVVLGVQGEARALVEDAQAGVVFPPEDAGELVKALQELAAAPERVKALGEAGRKYVEANFSRGALAEKYLGILEEVAKRR